MVSGKFLSAGNVGLCLPDQPDPICTDYDALRKQRLQKPLYPASILSVAAVSENAKVKAAARKNAIPEFMKFNIVENEVRNVI